MSRSRRQRKPKPPVAHRAPSPTHAAASSVARPGSRSVMLIVAACFVAGLGGGLLLRAWVVQRLPTDGPAVGSLPQSTTSTPIVAPPSTERAHPQDSSTSRGAERSFSSSDSHALRQAEQQFGVLFREGYQSFHQERYAEALDSFQRAVQAAPHLAEGHYYLGQTYAKLMLHDKAEQEYRECLDRMSDFRQAEEQLCILLYERGNYQEAITRLQAMLQQNARNPFALGELAINHLAIGDPMAAVPLLQQYNQLSGEQAWGVAHLGRAYDLQGDAAQAEENYRRALQIDPYFAIAHYWLGLLLTREGQQEASQASLSEYERLRSRLDEEHTLKMNLLRNSQDVMTLVRLAKVRYELGKHNDAMSTLERAYQLAPTHPEVIALRRKWASQTR